MASVRMTQQMRHDISRAAETAYDTSNPEPKPSTEFVDGLKQAIINSPEQKFFCEMIKLGYDRGLDKRHGKSLLPQKNKEPVTSIDLRRAKTSNISSNKDYEEHTIHFNTALDPFYVTEQTRYTWGNPSIYVQDLDPADQPQLLAQHDALLIDKKAWSDARYNYKQSIRNLLDKCSTLKQLLEIWPAAESLVESDKLAQMHVKVTRKQRAQQVREEIDFDPTLANQTVLTAKLLGG